MTKSATGLKSAAVTLKQVAEAANVHISTASRALDPTKSSRISAPTVTRVRDVAEQLGYSPDMVARGLKRGTTTTAGIVVADLENPFIGPVIRGIAGKLEQEGFVALVAETFDDHERLVRILNHLVSRRVDAIICSASRLGDGPLLKRAASEGLAIVLAVRGIPRSGLPSVMPDDRAGARLAADHLLELGHRVLAQLRGPQDVSSFVDRTRAFAQRVAADRIADVTVAETAAEPTAAEGRRLMQLTLKQNGPRPTGVFTQNDMVAIGAIDAIRAAGLECPRDISVVGFNDGPLADHVSPSLTTIRMPGVELGRRAAELALELIENPVSKHTPLSVPVTLVVRESTAPPPGLDMDGSRNLLPDRLRGEL
jgi:LacI family transcriptional regulator